MEIQKALKEIILRREMPQKLLGEKLNMTQSSVSDRLNKKQDLSVRTVLRFLNVLDCELVIRSKHKGKEEWGVTLAEGDDGAPKGHR